MKKRKAKHQQPGKRPRPTKLRIVGGEMRGRTLIYHGDPCTRPMKDRVREAAFNLIGPAVKDTFVIDLFAGTGAMALEAISRGAAEAVAIERHYLSAQGIRANAAALQVAERVNVITADAFDWFPRATLDPSPPWLVFCCPPYEYYVSRQPQMQELIQAQLDRAPKYSLLVLESDRRFDTSLLPSAANVEWDVRTYPPAVIAIGELL